MSYPAASRDLCQPFSEAGKRKGGTDARNMWPATINAIRLVRPKYVFLENVPGLLSSGYFRRILGDLAASGYDAQWRVLSAAEVGAPHKRNRLWIVANAQGLHWNGVPHESTMEMQGQSLWGIKPRRLARQGLPPSGDEPKRALYESSMGGMDDALASRVDRLKALGNAQVPAVAAAAWRLLTADLAPPAPKGGIT